MALEWDPEKMSTGVEEIDNQHKEWMHKFNEFEDAVLQGAGLQTLLESLDYLKHYSDTHFAAEEQAMALKHTPCQEENKLAHEEFRGKLAEISSWVNHAGVSTVEILELKMDLENWLTHHICTIDMHLREGDQNH